MDEPTAPELTGRFEARYRTFLETIASLRPSLHRYCCRMTGSVVDGEDIVQEALFDAYRRLDTFDESRALKPWLFRIAHNRCIDFLRRRDVRRAAETADLAPDTVDPAEPVGALLDRAVEHLVLALPPKERACVLLKDVLGHSLEEIADLVGSTVGGVKAALSRGRSKLAARPESRPPVSVATPELAGLLQCYVERFNRRDWAGLRELISADARLRVADRYAGALADSPYFGTYERWPTAWRLAVGQVDGEPAVIVHLLEGNAWQPSGLVHLEVVNHQIVRIADYLPCPWLLRAAGSIDPGEVL